MSKTSFGDLFRRAKKTDEYWTARAILQFTEDVCQAMEGISMTRADLAKALGHSAPYVSKLLRGDTNLTIKTMVRIARALKTTVELRLGTAKAQEAAVAIKSVASSYGPATLLLTVSTPKHFDDWGAPQDWPTNTVFLSHTSSSGNVSSRVLRVTNDGEQLPITIH